MSRNVRPGFKKFVLVLVCTGVAFAAFWIWGGDIFPERPVGQSNIPPKADLPEPAVAGNSNGAPPQARKPKSGDGSFPDVSGYIANTAACSGGTQVRWKHWYWNTHNGVIYANGGPNSKQGSLMCDNGVDLRMSREDEVPNQFAEMVKFVDELSKGNPHPRQGAHFISLMGDGTAALLTELNEKLEKYGPEYRAQIVGSGGYSRGEDCIMGPPKWRDNPQTAKGGLCAAYLRDGDWNIGMKWLGDNNICNNPDERTYDPNCFNWVNADGYIDAAQKYVAGYCEERDVVVNGRRTGEKRNVCVDCVATWTPGDNIVADQRGGLVRIASTREYQFQMPQAIIGVRKWMRDNPQVVEGMLEAIFKANQTIRDDDNAMRRASALAAVTYNEPNADAAYVYRYFKGVTEPDKTGLQVERGGSSVNNFADNCNLFGLQSCAPGSTSIFRKTYEVFGDIVVSQYPKLVPRYQPFDRVVDTSFLESIAARMRGKAVAAPELPTYTKTAPGAAPTRVISRKAWRIKFKSGSAAFTPAAKAELGKLFGDLVITNTRVEIHGHTDNTGVARENMALSESRAFAVRNWLHKKSKVNFPKNRFEVVAHGQTKPLEPNNSAGNRAKNRRVEIVMRAN